MERKIRWGIVGPGGIAHHFAKDLKLVDEGELVAVASRNLERAERFAEVYGAPHAFGSYDEIFKCEEVDIIYVATPHNAHASLAITAMEHGKHVLCEKPMGVNRKEVLAMVETAKKHKVFLMEALWSRFNPCIQEIKERIDRGDLGKIGYINADFAFYGLNKGLDSRILNTALAGGSLLDIGIYPIFLAYLILGKPERIQAASKFHSGGAEIQTSMIFSYTEAQAVLYSGLVSNSSMEAGITGDKAGIYIPSRWHEAQSYTIQKDGESTTIKSPTLGKGYSHEIHEVHQCLTKGKLESDKWSLQNSLDLIEIMDEIREMEGISFPFES